MATRFFRSPTGTLSNKSHQLSVISDFLVMLIAALMAIFSITIALKNSPNHFDIWLYDETFYLSRGIRHDQPLLFDPAQGGLYLALQSTFHFIHEPTYLYLYGGAIMIFASFVIMFLCFTFLSRSIIFSIFAIGLVLLSRTTTTWPYFAHAMDIWPRVSFAAIFILAMSFIIASLLEKNSQSLAVLTFGAFLAGFVRPEFVIAFYSLAAATAIIYIYEALQPVGKKTQHFHR